MPTYTYYEGSDGRVHRRLVTEKKLRGGERPDNHFSQTILKGYYKLEQEQGSRFKSGYSKNQIKRAHDNALARFEQTGAEV
jgi:hypothetical protein